MSPAIKGCKVIQTKEIIVLLIMQLFSSLFSRSVTVFLSSRVMVLALTVKNKNRFEPIEDF